MVRFEQYEKEEEDAIKAEKEKRIYDFWFDKNKAPTDRKKQEAEADMLDDDAIMSQIVELEVELNDWWTWTQLVASLVMSILSITLFWECKKWSKKNTNCYFVLIFMFIWDKRKCAFLFFCLARF